MAFYKKLTEGWRLSDGILPESLLEKPAYVYDALREAGRIPDAEMSLNAMECEWIYAREWTYSLKLDAPEEEDDRVYLELAKVSGTGKAYLNGEEIGPLYSGAVRLDMTGAIRREGGNLLELKFAPKFHVRPGMLRPLPETGLACAPVMRTINYALVDRMNVSSRLDGRDGIIDIELQVEAFVGGKYQFNYGVMLDGEPAGKFEFPEKLRAAKQTVRHEIRLAQAAFFDAERLEETIYSIKFTLERAGIGCDVRHTETAFRRNGPMRCAAVKQWPVTGDMIDRAMEMGADGIVLLGQPEDAFEKNDFLAGLTVVPDGERIGGGGMLTAEEMERYASGEKYWPMDTPVWRLRGGKAPGQGDAYGADAKTYAKAVRFLQAQRTAQEALRCRKENERAIVQLDEDFAYFASEALIERGGQERPAAKMLETVWNGAHIYCELPEEEQMKCDRLLQMNIWVLAENMRGSILTAKVSMLNEQGEKLAEQSFPIMGGEIRLAGAMEFRTPERNGLLIIRSELSEAKNGVISSMDSVIAAGDMPVMRLLTDAQPAELVSRFSGVRNEGKTAAIAAGRCLVPGEEMEKTEIEWINA